MTGGVELIGDLGAEEQKASDLLQLKVAINNTLKMTADSLRMLPPGNLRGQLEGTVKGTINEIIRAPNSLGNLTRGLGRLRKLNRLINLKKSDLQIPDIGATGEKNQWKKIIYGKPDDPKRSEEVIITPVKEKPKFVDINGVGNGMGEDYEDFGYYQDLAGLNDVDNIGVNEPDYVQKRTADAPSYEVPSRPGISPFETRIVEATGPGDVLAYHSPSVTENRDPASVNWTEPARKPTERGWGVDERARSHRTKGDGGGYSAKDDRKYEQILDGLDDQPKYVQARRGGGHTLIMDYDDYDESDFRYGSGQVGQSHLGDLGFSLPFNLPKPKLPFDLPNFKNPLDIPGDIAKQGKDLFGTFFQKGLEIVKLIIEKLTGMKDNFYGLITRAKDKAMDFASRGLKEAFDKANNVRKYAIKMFTDLTNKIKSALRNAKAFAYKYAKKAYAMAKRQAKKAYVLSKRYTNKAYRATTRNLDKLKGQVMKPLRSLNQRYESFKQMVTYGALALLGLIAVGGLVLIL